MKKNIKKLIIEYVNMTMAALLSAVAYYIFVLPNKIVPGGASGVASILQYATGFSATYGLLVLNAPLLILAVIYLSKDFAVKTIYATVVTSLFMQIFEWLRIPVFNADTIVSVLFGGVIAGASLIFSTNARGSTGGTEIIARIIVTKNPEIKAGDILFYCNLVIMTVGGFFTNTGVTYNVWLVVYSLIYSYICSFVLDRGVRGIDPAVKFTIITNKPNQVKDALFAIGKYGITSSPVYLPDGSLSSYTMLIVVSQFRRAYEVKKVLNATDKDCFAYTTDVDDVLSRPDFYKKVDKNDGKDI